MSHTRTSASTLFFVGFSSENLNFRGNGFSGLFPDVAAGVLRSSAERKLLSVSVATVLRLTEFFSRDDSVRIILFLVS